MTFLRARSPAFYEWRVNQPELTRPTDEWQLAVRN